MTSAKRAKWVFSPATRLQRHILKKNYFGGKTGQFKKILDYFLFFSLPLSPKPRPAWFAEHVPFISLFCFLILAVLLTLFVHQVADYIARWPENAIYFKIIAPLLLLCICRWPMAIEVKMRNNLDRSTELCCPSLPVICDVALLAVETPSSNPCSSEWPRPVRALLVSFITRLEPVLSSRHNFQSSRFFKEFIRIFSSLIKFFLYLALLISRKME